VSTHQRPQLASCAHTSPSVFLERLHLGPHISADVASALDKHYGFSSETNGEILLAFFLVALEDKKTQYAEKCAAWVPTVGRMKYARPLYRSLFLIKPELARETFVANRTFYHPIAAALIEKVSSLPPPFRATCRVLNAPFPLRRISDSLLRHPLLRHPVSLYHHLFRTSASAQCQLYSHRGTS